MKRITPILILVGLIVSTQTWGQEKLRVGFLPFPPFAMSVGEEKVSGISVERVVGILNKLKIDYEVQIYPPKRLHLLMAAGDLDFMLGTKTNKVFQQHVHYSRKPYLTLKMMLYTTKDMDISGNLDELGGVVGMLHGYRLPGMMNKEKITLYSVSVHEQLFLMLTANPKRLDYVIDYETPAKIEMEKNNISLSDLKSRVLYTMPLYFCVRKTYSGSIELLRRVEEVNETYFSN